ncbi:hypothetical protein [Butyrivibrio sp. AD3002]|uniref:hypothetical protein n=1 Tax=Butyrivibrio sp. AD3002 TaxID=1280670 RepID=UPI0003B7B9F0|nr:hypothetical protein [Butyrivibrio sp. AD3002]
MGTSFRNIQVYNPGHKNQYELEEDYCIEHLTPDWDTIFEDNLETEFEDVREEAVRLSERLDTPVISISYFDDMLFAIEVLEGGKSTAYHFVGDEGMDTKNIQELFKALRLEPELEIPFRNVIKKAGFAPDSMQLIEDLARIPIGAFSIKDEEDYYRFRDREEILDEISKL